MTPPRAVARNLLLTISVLRKHLGRPGPKISSVVLRHGSPQLRRAVASPWVQRRRPDLAALALAADGRSDCASALLHASLVDPCGKKMNARRVAHAAVVLHDVPLAARAVEVEAGREASGAAPPPRIAVVRGVVAAERGEIDEALAHLNGVAGGTARRLRARLTGERQVLRSELLAQAFARRSPPARDSGNESVRSVLHVVSTSLPEQQSGYTIRTQGLVNGQRASGLNAQVVTRLGFPVDVGAVGAARRVDVDGVAYHRLLPARGIPIPGARRQARAVKELTELVLREQPDLLHAHSKHENAQIALIVGREQGLPVVYEARGFLEETWASSGGDPGSDFYRWSRETETRCMRYSDAVITLSSAMAEDIAGRGIAEERITVVPNAVADDFAAGALSGDPSEGSRDVSSSRLRSRLGIPVQSTVFGSVSTLNHYEGFDTVIEAMARSRDPGLVLVLVGDGPARAELQRVARSAGVEDQVVFTGRVNHDQVRVHLKAMDVFVVPRRDTPVTRLVPPIKPLEAMAAGLPVLASDLPPLVEIVRPGVFGAVAAPESAARWAEQMTALRYAPEHRRDLGSRAADFVARERTWARAAQRYAGIYAAAVCR